MTKHEYYRGQKGRKYGIYNTQTKCFQFGVSEDTPALAVARLFQKIGDDARKWRFEPRALPPDGLTIKQSTIDEIHTENETKYPPCPDGARWKGAGMGYYTCSWCGLETSGTMRTCPRCKSEMDPPKRRFGE